MNEVESATNAGGTVHLVLGRSDSVEDQSQLVEPISDESSDPLAQGPLSLVRSRIGDDLIRSGFINLTGKILDNFRVFLNGQPPMMDVQNLKPGILEQLNEWVAEALTANPDQAVAAQANVRSEDAVTLLT
jgi:hypothetical protein